MTQRFELRWGLAARPAELLAGGLIGFYAAAMAFAPGIETQLALALIPVSIAALWWTLGNTGRWFFAFAAATLLLPPLPFGWGETGPHIAVVFVGLGVFAWLARLDRWRMANGLLPVMLLVFLAMIVCSGGLAWIYSGADLAAGSLARSGLFSISVFAFFYFAGGSDSALDAPLWFRRLFLLGTLSAAIACLDFYFQWSPLTDYGEQFVRLPSAILRRAQGVFYEAGLLGNACAFFLLLAILLGLRPEICERVVSRPALFLGGLVICVALLLSFSRAALLNAVVGAMAFLIIDHSRQRLIRFSALAGGIGAAAVALAYGLFPEFMMSYTGRLWVTSTRLLDSPETLLAGRLQTWQAIIETLAAHPWHLFFGVGFKTLPYGGLAGQPVIGDNMYLTLLAETGVVGLSAFLLLNLAILRAAYRAARCKNRHASFLGAWIFCFWIGEMFQMLAADVLTYWRVLPIYFAVLGWAAAATREAAEREPAMG